MDASSAYILVAVVALAAIALVTFVVRGRSGRSRLTPLAGVAFACVVAGIVFADDRRVGYGLIGAGVVLAVIAIISKWRRRAV